MKKAILIFTMALSCFVSCLPRDIPQNLKNIKFPLQLSEKKSGGKKPQNPLIHHYGLVTVIYLPGSRGLPAVESLDAWYREASWYTGLPARGVLVLAGKPKTENPAMRGDSFPGGIFVISGQGDSVLWRQIMGRSLILSSVHPLARGFLPRWVVLGTSVLAARPEQTSDKLALLVKGRRIIFENRRFSLYPGKALTEEEALISAGFFRYLIERYGEYRFYQYLAGTTMDPGSAEGLLFERMFGVSFSLALSQYCDYLSKGAKL